MKSKRVLLIAAVLTIALAFYLWFNNVEKDFGTSRLLVSAENGPTEMWDRIRPNSELQVLPSLIEKVDNQEKLRTMWKYFNMSEEVPIINFKKNAVLFVSIYESSCPIIVKDIMVNDKK
ncbi:hypothetical protein ACLM5H_21520 [Fredinandcohnia humi]